MRPSYEDSVAGENGRMVPAVGAYEDLIGFQRGTIREQARVIEALTNTIEHLQRTFTRTDGVVDAQIQDGGHL